MMVMVMVMMGECLDCAADLALSRTPAVVNNRWPPAAVNCRRVYPR
jgi:hypothetical protein